MEALIIFLGMRSAMQHGPQYEALWAFSPAEEKMAFEQLIDMIVDRRVRDPGMHVYHYAPYEVTAMKRLMGRYGTRADELDQLLRAEVFVDLYGVVRKGLRAGVDSYSIKKSRNLLWAHTKGRPSSGLAPSSGRRVRHRPRQTLRL